MTVMAETQNADELATWKQIAAKLAYLVASSEHPGASVPEKERLAADLLAGVMRHEGLGQKGRSE